MQGVENVYTQHTPLLLNILEALVKGRLKDGDFPYIDRASNTGTPAKIPKVCASTQHLLKHKSAILHSEACASAVSICGAKSPWLCMMLGD